MWQLATIIILKHENGLVQKQTTWFEQIESVNLENIKLKFGLIIY